MEHSTLFQRADVYLNRTGINQRFLQEIIEPQSRQTGRNLEELSALDLLLSARNSEKLKVRTGFSQLIKQLLRRSDADVRPSTSVRSIGPGLEKRYRLILQSASGISNEEFDVAILAAPLSVLNINFGELQLPPNFARTSSVQKYITHVALQEDSTPNFFNLTKVTEDIMTVSDSNLPIYDIRYVGGKCHRYHFAPSDRIDHDVCDRENVYRILSPALLSNDTVAKILSHPNHFLPNLD